MEREDHLTPGKEERKEEGRRRGCSELYLLMLDFILYRHVYFGMPFSWILKF